MEIFLSGGGNAEQSAALDKLYFDGLANNSVITYIPVALTGKRTFAQCRAWFEELCSSYGDFRLNVLQDLRNQGGSLKDSDAVYIGGGNTYNLLRELKSTKFDSHLETFACSGKPIYGGSAGAVVLGKEIGTVKFMDRDEHNTSNTAGLNLVCGYSIWPHYHSAEDQRIKEYVAETSIPVLGLSEDAGVCVTSKLKSIGTVWHFDSNGKIEYTQCSS